MATKELKDIMTDLQKSSDPHAGTLLQKVGNEIKELDGNSVAKASAGTDEIHNLTQTATDDDIKSGNFFALDGAEGTKRLPVTEIRNLAISGQSSFLKNKKLINGKFLAPAQTINDYTPDQKVGLYNVIVPYSIITQIKVKNGYNVAFPAFAADGHLVRQPPSWFIPGEDGVVTIEQIINSNYHYLAVGFAIQIREAGVDRVFDYTGYSLFDFVDCTFSNEERFEDIERRLGATELLVRQHEELPYIQYITNDLSWLQGSPTDSTRATRIHSSPRKFFKKGDVIKCSDVTKYNYVVYEYKEDGTPIRGGSVWETSPTYEIEQDCYVVLQVRIVGDSNISPAIFDGSVFSFYRVVKFGEENLSSSVVEKLNREQPNYVDLFLFAGQSNMAGRGVSNSAHPETAPTIISGAGFEFRAISDPSKLYPMAEPFGVNENNVNGINEPGRKTGSMVTAFTNAYYQATKTPVVGVSASKGGTKISLWQEDGVLLPDALQRFTDAVNYLTANGYMIRHKYVLWCQGESDGDASTTAESYKNLLNSLLSSFKSVGIEKMFLVRIGRINTGDFTKYDYLIDAQTQICKTNKDVVMATTDLYSMQARGLMKDDFHYFQAGYNEVGTYAGVNVGTFVATGKEQTMFDPKTNALYFSEKN